MFGDMRTKCQVHVSAHKVSRTSVHGKTCVNIPNRTMMDNKLYPTLKVVKAVV